MKKMVGISEIHKLPAKIGVYLLYDKDGKIIYIGKSTNIKERVKTHLKIRGKTPINPGALPFSSTLLSKTEKISYILAQNEPEALIKESELIKKHKPRYNIMLRDDKQYFYVQFLPQGRKAKNKDLEKLPYITITHQPRNFPRYTATPPNTKYKALNTRCAGPFTDGGSLKTVLRYLRKVFPYYTKPHGKLPCQYCHIERCPGPDPDIKEYIKNISKIKQILNGKKPRVIISLKKEMKKYSDNLEFEKAEKAKRQIAALENIFSHNSPHNFKIQMSNDKSMTKSQMTQTEHFDIEKLGVDLTFGFRDLAFISLEAYDISNIQGREPVASMVRFENGKPNKKMYRRFKIRLPEKPDDFAMIREVIRRRLAHPEWPYPDLFLIDGGKGQLNAALAAFKQDTRCPTHKSTPRPSEALRSEGGEGRGKIQDTKVAALAKQENELFFPGRKESIKLKDIDPKIRNLLMYARDEAHRFAITYHRKLHRKKATFSP